MQRTLKASRKGRNVAGYARYIAAGFNGEHGAAWSTPPITLWLAGEPGAVSEELIPGSGTRRVTLLAGVPVVAIDGETQVTAPHELYDDPTPPGVLNFGGGAKDSGGRVADAILYPDTESGRRVRASDQRPVSRERGNTYPAPNPRARRAERQGAGPDRAGHGG